ncbi:hypothetical protein [Pseudomonas sp. H3(2019)]|uniref:hypothetical protein n=1 Tax=Pseudomonas sp. H3(2019) TaxID=2598724 RepID=UPI00118F5967|nr:hypothetical protein [Pseudomonas sp. H3(2019)]TVT81547.1 hypothetical protein FPT12_19005 [Pseudomonas sp. H3(2019)]
MTKVENALVVSIGEIVEEEVVLLVNGVLIKCFMSYCPEKIMVGARYEVELEMILPDSSFVVTAQETDVMVEMLGDGFSGFLYGYLDGSVFRSFVEFFDQEIHHEHPSLNGQFVKVKVDRIDVAF